MYSISNFISEYGTHFLKEHKLPQMVCERCKKNGYELFGDCETCLRNRAKVMEWLETHPFVGDDELRGYHCGRHSVYKTIPLRLPDEHPFLYYGLEVEVDFDRDMVSLRGEDYDDEYDEDYDDEERTNISEIVKRFNEITGGLSVWETDASLDYGAECIFRPMSYAYITSPEVVEKLTKAFEYLKEVGAFMEQPSGNGLHIHISKAFFEHGRRTDMRGNSICSGEMYSNYNWLFQVFQTEVEQLGGRKYGEWCRSDKHKAEQSVINYAGRLTDNGIKFEGVKLTKTAMKELPRGDHNSSINSTDKTVETRVFKSSIDVKEILARLELVRNVAHASREGYTEITFGDLLHFKDNKFLDDYVRKVKFQLAKRGEKLDLNKTGVEEIALEI